MIGRIVQKFINHSQTRRVVMSSEVTGAISKRPGDEATDEVIKKTKLELEKSDDVSVKKMKPPKRKKIALLTVYSGKGYHGVQIQTQQVGVPTIEGELVQALLKTNLIEQEHADDMSKMWFQRASRTDKGVSAAGQVFSLLMRMDITDPVSKLNAELPSNIRVLAVKNTTKMFDAKNSCSYRTYEYLSPTFAFTPLDEQTTESYRISDNLVAHINEVMQNFKGTHNFHNFTSRRKWNDRSATRYMMSFEAGKPFLLDGVEFLVITVRGQSFMLHQIRKMIGLTMAVAKGYAGLDTIEMCWGPTKVDIPKAPGLGLLLDKLHYDGYNKRYGSDGIHEPIDWLHYAEQIEKFKMDHVYADIMKTEKEEKSMMEWLKSMHLHTFQMYVDRPSTSSKIDKSDGEEEEATTKTDSANQISTKGDNFDKPASSNTVTGSVNCVTDTSGDTENLPEVTLGEGGKISATGVSISNDSAESTPRLQEQAGGTSIDVCIETPSVESTAKS